MDVKYFRLITQISTVKVQIPDKLANISRKKIVAGTSWKKERLETAFTALPEKRKPWKQRLRHFLKKGRPGNGVFGTSWKKEGLETAFSALPGGKKPC